MIVALAIVSGLSVIGMVVTNFLWLKHVRYLTNLAVSRTPVEFVTLQSNSKPEPKDIERTKRIRPEGI